MKTRGVQRGDGVMLRAEPDVSATAVAFVPLAQERRTHVDTATLCWHLNRAPQTVRLWACKETYPEGLRPIRVNGRLSWPVAGIRKILGVA